MLIEKLRHFETYIFLMRTSTCTPSLGYDYIIFQTVIFLTINEKHILERH
jgi:hypothetical protein